MKKFLLLGMILLTATSFAAKPKWLTDTSSICKKSELCAVGEGESRNFAVQAARISIAKYFSTHIKSTFTQEISSYGGKISDDASEQIEEITEGVLEGVEIRKVYEGELYIYALAVMNKRKAANSFRQEIQKLDDKMKMYLADKSASTAAKLEDLFVQREGINKRYALVAGMGLPPVISYKQIFKAKKTRVGKVVVHVFIDEKHPKVLEPEVVQFLTKQGFGVTTGQVRSKKSTHVLSGVVTPEKQYLKVEGFTKYKFQVELSSYDIRNVTKGHVVFSDVQTGRNFSQAYEKAMPTLMEELKSNMNKLDFD